MGAGSQLSLLSAWGQCAVVRSCAVHCCRRRCRCTSLPAWPAALPMRLPPVCCPLCPPCHAPAGLTMPSSSSTHCPRLSWCGWTSAATARTWSSPTRCCRLWHGSRAWRRRQQRRRQSCARRQRMRTQTGGCARGSGPNFMHPLNLNPSDPSEHCIPFPRLLSSTQPLVLWRNLAFPARVACLLQVPHSQEGLPTDARSPCWTGGHSPAPVDPNSLFMVSMVAEQQIPAEQVGLPALTRFASSGNHHPKRAGTPSRFVAVAALAAATLNLVQGLSEWKGPPGSRNCCALGAQGQDAWRASLPHILSPSQPSPGLHSPSQSCDHKHAA